MPPSIPFSPNGNLEFCSLMFSTEADVAYPTPSSPPLPNGEDRAPQLFLLFFRWSSNFSPRHLFKLLSFFAAGLLSAPPAVSLSSPLLSRWTSPLPFQSFLASHFSLSPFCRLSWRYGMPNIRTMRSFFWSVWHFGFRTFFTNERFPARWFTYVCPGHRC